MCGRFLFIPEGELKEILMAVTAKLKAMDIPYTAKSGEVFPTQLVPILGHKDGQLSASPAFWGFTNDMRSENTKRAAEGKKPLKPKAVFNTRGDKADKISFWQDSYRKRRCLVPTSGFYEWQTQEDGSKNEYHFSLPGQDITMIAGIWHLEKDKQTGICMPHFSMITTEPCQSILDVHDRMPVVLQAGEYDRWLDGDYQSLLDRSNIQLERRTA